MTTNAKEEPQPARGRFTSADDLFNKELKSALTEYNEAYVARGAEEARMLRALAAAYKIAWERSSAAVAAPDEYHPGTREEVFEWHFSSILGEFALGSHDSERSLRGRAHDAHRLVTEFAEWVDEIEAGLVDIRHARAMLKHTRVLEPEHFAEYSAQVLEFGRRHTAGQTDTQAERLAATIAAKSFEESHKLARADRFVSLRHDGLGMSMLTAYLPTELASPIAKLLDVRARETREADRAAAEDHRRQAGAAEARGETPPAEFAPDTRTTAQIRADIFAETLLCATPGESQVKAVVSIVVPALSLLTGRADGSEPALLNGMHPISFDEACQLAGEATAFRRVLTDPVTGHTRSVEAYTPDASLRRFLQVRDRTCRFPGCVRPAMQCEADHTKPFSEGGRTSESNMAHLCRSHHVQKHEKPWTVTNLGGGVLEWRTPLGQVVTTEPVAMGPKFVPTDQAAGSGLAEEAPPKSGAEENSASLPETGDEDETPPF
ncbi:HNH endonuclease signature motif containing protein [Gulosibacter molinativorax]|uniref:HNH endonuclease signature motif containing protein n=1 Tax=Gulosibacter molinativorax TaxID=256821 RepID=UPI0003F8F724|nr:HNH endonuclease signature motif containing protein [Gulosibacter molinativorax]QUY61384.1 HNH endonuclease [Gulosibacter molinativorax]